MISNARCWYRICNLVSSIRLSIINIVDVAMLPYRIQCCRYRVQSKRRVTSIIQVAYGYMRQYLSDETNIEGREGGAGDESR